MLVVEASDTEETQDKRTVVIGDEFKAVTLPLPTMLSPIDSRPVTPGQGIVIPG